VDDIASRERKTLVSRRQLLRSSAAGTAGLAFGGLVGRVASAAVLPFSPDYGPLFPAIDETTGLPLLRLPEGFTYRSFGWTGDPMADGMPTPSAHDGMGVIAVNGNRITLCRNHERGTGAPFANHLRAYDSNAGGGNTNLVFDVLKGEWVNAWSSLTGTIRNCAGGITPWGSWLSCEETTIGPETDDRHALTHGWVFEVPAFAPASADPLTGLGRFSHEAAAVDPVTGIVYETEDTGSSGFYRFVPREYGRLDRGGQLQMLAIKGLPQFNTHNVGNDSPVKEWDVEWVDIVDPERAHRPGTTDGQGVFRQGFDQGGARFTRGEGCWYDGGRVYFVATTGGPAGRGQVFEYDPRSETLRLIYASPNAAVLNSPDNIAVSPRGGLILCEDGSRNGQMLHGLTRDGQIFPFAQNDIVLNGERNGIAGNFRGSEWCGATFYGRWLFVNIQSPGITFAITGPWDNGAL